MIICILFGAWKNSVSKNHKLSTVSLFIHGRFSLSVYRTSPFLTISPLLTISRLTYSLQSHSPGFKSRFHFLFYSLRPRKHRRLQFVLSNLQGKKWLQSISKSFERCLIASIDKRIYSDTVTSYLKHENRYFGFTCVYFECKNKFYSTLINGNVTWM